MGELSSTSAQVGMLGTAAAVDGKRTGLSFKEYQELKSSVHRDLISRVDRSGSRPRGMNTPADKYSR